MSKVLLTGLSLMFLFACAATVSKPTFEGDAFISHRPVLEVKFKKPVREMKPVGRDYDFSFYEGLPVRIDFTHMRHVNVDYFYSLEQIATNVRYDFLGSIHVAGTKWAKFAFLNKKDYLLTGYFTRKHKVVIQIYNYRKLDEERLEKYKRRREERKGQPGYLGKRFRKLDNALEIVR